PPARRRRHVDWTLPPGRPNWFVGSGATVGEQAVVWATVGAGLVLALAVARDLDVSWTWWHHVVAVILVVDVVGGVVANGLGSAKRLYHGHDPVPGAAGRWLRNDLVFAAAHLPHLVLAATLPGGTVGWAMVWYAVILSGVAAVVAAPQHLTRPIGLAVATVAVLVASLVTGPDALGWFGPVIVLKLVLAHAVPEEPYRPAPETC
ncbi:MAG TPA: hypothetical protein VK866_08125, partial [Acidimicrobiales bacterium]|nr:hypothetical protein [Acidimicrobiales bacterium]